MIKNFPPYSPDMNGIEKLWPRVNAGVSVFAPSNLAELKIAAVKAWKAIPQSVIDGICRGQLGVARKVAKGGGLYG